MSAPTGGTVAKFSSGPGAADATTVPGGQLWRGPVRALAERPLATRNEPSDAAAASPLGSDEVTSTVRAWARAWSSQNVDSYLGFYGHHFAPADGISRAHWNEQRRQRLERPSFIEVAVQGVEVTFSAPDRAFARFTQIYRSNMLTSRVTKVLRLSWTNGQWKIVRESVKR